MDIRKELLEILSDYVDIPAEGIDTSEGMKFSSGLDSFGLMSMISSVEEHFDVSISDEDLLNFKTLDDIILFIARAKK